MSLVKRIPALKPEEAAEFLELSVETLKTQRCRGGGPVYVRMANGRIRYPLDKLYQYRDGEMRVSTTKLYEPDAATT